MILPILVLLAIQVGCQGEGALYGMKVEDEYEQLSKIESEIERRTSRQQYLELKLSRLFEHSMKFNEVNLTIEQVSILPSISIPYKDNLYYSMLLKRNQNYYTLRGDLVLGQTHNPILVSSIRNEHTYFSQFFSNRTSKISKLKIITKKTHIELEVMIDLGAYSGTSFDFFVAAHHSASKYYIFASSKERLIVVFEKNGTLCKTMKTNKKILQVNKINNNLVFLTEDELFFLNINKNMSKTSCLMPYDPVDYFSYDQSNLKFVYAKQNDSIYQFELNSHCKPINQFHILPDSTFFPAGQMLFLSTPSLSYAINTTNSHSTIYSFPFGQCLGSRKIEINRKIQTSYIVSQICLGESHLNLTHILIELQDSSSEVTDFSKFRIPLLFFSFGIIIYVTVKNKSKDKPQEEDVNEKEIQENILKKIASLKGQPPSPADEPPLPPIQSQTILQKKAKKA